MAGTSQGYIPSLAATAAAAGVVGIAIGYLARSKQEATLSTPLQDAAALTKDEVPAHFTADALCLATPIPSRWPVPPLPRYTIFARSISAARRASHMRTLFP